MALNPFNYGKPIDDPARFIGRKREIEQIYSRLLSACESTSIVGERRMGKTSLLKLLGHPTIQARFGVEPGKFIFVFQDFLFLDGETVPTRFWQRVLRAIGRAVKTYPDIVAEIEAAGKATTIDNYTLDDIFTLIDDEGINIVLLLDEFENVTRNQQFDSDFFGGLRALAIHHNLALITSSRQDLIDLTHSDTVRSSPFFNIFATINLRAFSETDATDLIDHYLAGSEVKFLIRELNTMFAVAGYHPYFLQMACHHLFAAHQQGLDDRDRRRYLVDQVRSEIKPLFQDYWQSSTPSQQIVLIVMALRELERRSERSDLLKKGDSVTSLTGPGEDTIEELEKFYGRASQIVSELERRGLIIKKTGTSTYHLCSAELSEWIADEIVGDVDDARSWRNWQKDETMVGTLPVTLQDMLAEAVRGLNPAYQKTLGNWLLEPSTAMASLKLLRTFVGRYEQYQATRSQRDAVVTMSNDQAPVGDTPKGLFAMISQRVEAQETGQPTTLNLDNATKAASKELREAQVYGLKRQLIDQTKNLNKLMEEAAMYGSLTSAPLKLQNEIERIEETIASLQEQLTELEAEG